MELKGHMNILLEIVINYVTIGSLILKSKEVYNG